MLYHTLKLIYRNILRFPGTFSINVVGLSTGLVCSLFIYLWISDELSFDKFHQHSEHIFQVVENQHTDAGIVSREETPFGMAYVLGEAIPEIAYTATVTPTAWLPKFILENKSEKIKGEGRFVGKDFFEIFSFDLAYGTKANALSDINSIVISDALAIKLFGSVADAPGKTIPWNVAGIQKSCTVSGIFKTLPANSSEQFDLLLNIELLGQIMNIKKDDLSGPGPSTFVRLKPGTGVANVNAKISQLMSERTSNKQSDFFLSKYSDKYLYGKYENGIQAGGRIEYVKLFSIIGIIILVVACINFMNLSTAKASRRMKEVGIKKTMGAWRSSLVTQYFAESIVIAFASLCLALIVVTLLLPYFNELTGKQIALDLTTEKVLGILGITLFTGIMAGSYPALYLSGFRPVQILKGKTLTSYSESFIRRGLVVFQFAVSIIFIASVIVIYNQMSFIQNRTLGYDKDNIIYLEIEGEVALHKEAFVQAVKSIPGVEDASAMVGNIVGAFGHPRELAFEEKRILVNHLMIDYDMIETLGVTLKNGRTFSVDHNDADKVILNNVAADQLGLKNPVGNTIDFSGRQFEVIGVTENFHYRSLHEAITPLAFMLETQQLSNIFVRLESNKQEEAMQKIAALYKTFNPGYAFDPTFLDHTYQSQYGGEKQVANLSLWFSILTIVIACLGLFGLAAFTAKKRIKEIGIRKILGATPASIAYLLSSEFIKLVFIAMAIGLPVSFYLTAEWLERFAYAIDLEIWFFAASGIIAVLIAVATVGGQAIKTAIANPVNALKDE